MLPTSSGPHRRACGIILSHLIFATAVILLALSNPVSRNFSLPSKFIIYSNRRVKIKGIHSKLSLWLDCNDYHLDDTVLLVRTLTLEQKAHHIKAFIKSAVDSDFHPRILSATSGAANAGIDSTQVFGVFRVDFPPNMVDMKDEGDRAGRRPEWLIVEDFYCVMISLEGFLHLFLHILNPDESVHDSSYHKQQLEDLLWTLRFSGESGSESLCQSSSSSSSSSCGMYWQWWEASRPYCCCCCSLLGDYWAYVKITIVVLSNWRTAIQGL
jgi:hypothetical protein